MSIESGVLYVVATPIGNLGDLSPRAESILRSVDLVAAEDTRHSRPLLQHFGIDTPLTAYHEHNERQAMERLLERLQQGANIALISDAGTPLISDPGFPLVRECRMRGIRVSPIPGPSALIAALCAAGMPTDRFSFEGFPARTRSARLRQFESLVMEPRSLIFYESGHRVLESLQDMAVAFGNDRQAVLARELTKTFETFIAAPLSELAARVTQDPLQQKGELVILISGYTPPEGELLSREEERILRLLLEEMPLKQAAALAARITGAKKNRLYEQALAWQKGD